MRCSPTYVIIYGLLLLLLCMCRGKQFRKEYACLGEIRGLLGTNVNMMALTATATKENRRDICKSLGLLKPVMILKSPEKCNIFYNVTQKSGDIEEIFAPLVEEL